MFGLAPFASAPFSSILTVTTNTAVTGLQANALLGTVGAGPVVSVSVTGVYATAYLMNPSNTTTTPSYWTYVDSSQYPI
jgi:hypothetical protein